MSALMYPARELVRSISARLSPREQPRKCLQCLDDFSVQEGLACHGEGRHFTCKNCFAGWVGHCCNERHKLRMRRGKIFCFGPNCPSDPWSTKEVMGGLARHEDMLARYIDTLADEVSIDKGEVPATSARPKFTWPSIFSWNNEGQIAARREAIKASTRNTINAALCMTCPNPKCRVGVQQSGGCNSMQCTNCNQFFCWLCFCCPSGRDARTSHDHVRQCPQNPAPGDLFGDVQAAHKRKRVENVQLALTAAFGNAWQRDADVCSELRAMCQDSMRRDWGIDYEDIDERSAQMLAEAQRQEQAVARGFFSAAAYWLIMALYFAALCLIVSLFVERKLISEYFKLGVDQVKAVAGSIEQGGGKAPPAALCGEIPYLGPYVAGFHLWLGPVAKSIGRQLRAMMVELLSLPGALDAFRNLETFGAWALSNAAMGVICLVPAALGIFGFQKCYNWTICLAGRVFAMTCIFAQIGAFAGIQRFSKFPSSGYTLSFWHSQVPAVIFSLLALVSLRLKWFKLYLLFAGICTFFALWPLLQDFAYSPEAFVASIAAVYCIEMRSYRAIAAGSPLPHRAADGRWLDAASALLLLVIAVVRPVSGSRDNDVIWFYLTLLGILLAFRYFVWADWVVVRDPQAEERLMDHVQRQRALYRFAWGLVLTAGFHFTRKAQIFFLYLYLLL